MLNLQTPQNPPTTHLSLLHKSSSPSLSNFSSSSSSAGVRTFSDAFCLDSSVSMDAVTPSPPTLTCTLDLSISIPGSSSSSARDLNINRLIKRSSKRAEPEDEKWININIGCPNSSEDTEDNDTDSPYAGCVRRREELDNNQPPRKKLRLSKEQSRLLEESFRQNHTLNPRQKEELAKNLKLRLRQVEVWFQNRRARSKLKQTEIECEYLKRWFGSLSERNQKLQKEVEELRAMKVGPSNVMSAHGCEQSLTMCPRCERVSSTTTAYVEKAASGSTSTAYVSDVGTNLQQCRQPSAAFSL